MASGGIAIGPHFERNNFDTAVSPRLYLLNSVFGFGEEVAALLDQRHSLCIPLYGFFQSDLTTLDLVGNRF